MADETNGSANGAATPASEGEQPPVEAQVAAQYIKDLSFENPNVERLLDGPGDSPNLQLEVNVNGRQMSDGLYESAIDFKAHATNKDGTIYEFECIYAGLFKIKNLPEQSIEPFLLINCPTILFPFLRRIVADLTREGGFPPLLLDPIDFAGLFVNRKREEAAASQSS